MTDAVLEFLLHFPPPASTVELWGEINSVRVYACNPMSDLPATSEALNDALRLLVVAGKVELVNGQWKPLAQRLKVDRQGALFA